MLRPCFETSLEEDSDSDEAAWDSAARKCEGVEDARGLCGNCGSVLRRFAKVPQYAALLRCSSKKDCAKCDQTILPGEMHFACSSCKDYHVCKDCGPGIFVSRNYDYYDPQTGEINVQAMPSKVVHDRAAKTKQKNKRSAMLTTEASKLAKQIIENVTEICAEIADEEDEFDAQWAPPQLLERLLGVGSDGLADAVHLLVEATREILKDQSTLSEVKAVPCKVYGDLHGQFRDLMLYFHSYGVPGSSACPNCVFNGDFVDRGKHQIEVVCTLFALKICYPEEVFLNRGNHEDQHMNQKYGFKSACLERFGQEQGVQIFEEICGVFNFLPLATLIEGKVLALHGGIGDGQWELKDLKAVQRPLTHEDLQRDHNRWIWNILWSDPIEDDSAGDSSVFGVHQSPRSKLAVKFGWNVSQVFCARNGIDLIIRSHQSKKNGFGFDVMHNETLIRVFSARDYEKNNNDGAILSITHEQETEGCLTVRSQVLGSLSKEYD